VFSVSSSTSDPDTWNTMAMTVPAGASIFIHPVGVHYNRTSYEIWIELKTINTHDTRSEILERPVYFQTRTILRKLESRCVPWFLCWLTVCYIRWPHVDLILKFKSKILCRKEVSYCSVSIRIITHVVSPDLPKWREYQF
jgi:hypothetical protein